MTEVKLTERAQMLINNSHDWYVVTLVDGSYELKHSTALSAIIECGEPAEEYGYTAIEKCWNGDDLTTEDDWV